MDAEVADESTAETEDSQDSQDSQGSQDSQEPFPSEDLMGSASEEEVSDSIDEFTSPDVDPTPHQRKRSAVKVSSVHKKSRTDENRP